jgi:2-polyprenyl-3-methyl-5-hydroxy-6-metoxy-1,4-benzoquinol methylase
VISKYAPDCKLLDCACGDGYSGLRIYLGRGLRPELCYAVDKEKKHLKKLVETGVRTVWADLETSNLTSILPVKFDVIVSAETLEHLTQKGEDRTLASFVKLLSEGGSLVITFPAHALQNKQPGHIRQPNPVAIVNRWGSSFEECTVQELETKSKKRNVFIFLRKKHA